MKRQRTTTMLASKGPKILLPITWYNEVDQFCIPLMPWRGECRLLGSGRSLNWHNSKLQNNCQDHMPPPPITHQKLEMERTETLHLEVLEAFIFSTMWIGNSPISRFLVGWFIYVNVEFQLEERCSMRSRYREVHGQIQRKALLKVYSLHSGLPHYRTLLESAIWH